MMLFPKPTKIREPKYLRGFQHEDCTAKHLGGCGGDVCASHLDSSGGKGMGTKVDDSATNPLCFIHSRQEEKDRFGFWHKLFAEDTFFLVQCLKAYRFLKFLKWLASEGRESEITELLKRF